MVVSSPPAHCCSPHASFRSFILLPPPTQDIITASPNFAVDAFIPKLRDYMRVQVGGWGCTAGGGV